MTMLRDIVNKEKEQATWSAIEVAGASAREWSKDDETRIRRRLDFRIMPTVFITSSVSSIGMSSRKPL
jgi:hypothetical protein